MAPTLYYVDPAGGSNANNGSIGNPWQTCQWALDHITRDATNGDQINIKAGGTDTLAAPLALTTYGTPAIQAPLIFSGYTSVANDGGVGRISGGGTVATIIASAPSYVLFVDLRLGSTTSSVFTTGTDCALIRCEVDTSGGSAISLGPSSRVIACYVHDSGGHGISVTGSGGHILFNYITGWAAGNNAISSGTYNTLAIVGNVIWATGATRSGIVIASGAQAYGLLIAQNTLYNSAAGTGVGIQINNSITIGQICVDNVVEGWSGVGGVGIRATGPVMCSGSNAVYNCTTNFQYTAGVLCQLSADVALVASPFTNPAAGDFSVSAALAALAYPASFGGLPGTSSYGDIGAVQRQAAGGAVSISPMLGVIG